MSCTRSRPGLSLIEMLVTLAIFVVLAGFMFIAVQTVITHWKASERRRALYEKAAAVVDVMTDDIRLATSYESPGATEVKVKFIGDYDPESPHAHRQRLMFVRTFEAGPERALVGNAGDGRPNLASLKPSENGDEPPAGKVDGDNFDGLKIGDYKAIGGLAMIGYFVKDQTLYRAIRAPVQGSMTALCEPLKSQPLATDVLYLGFDYWSQRTVSWDDPPANSKDRDTGPQRIWDSTRGITAAPLNRFFLHRTGSLNDPEDDVFPRKVRITVTVDSDFPRCLYTRLMEETGDADREIFVDNTKSFPDGGDEDSYLLIDNEWMHYSKRSAERFVIDKRGARDTIPDMHKRDAVVRCGHTFQRVVYIPNWREDFTPDDVYFARRKARTQKPRTIMEKAASQ